MALVPSDDEVKKAQEHAKRKIRDKRRKQRAEGKDFFVPEDGHAAGVIPEKDWQRMKK